ncbi:MAG TPA: DUF1549 and DUF1553 domain-containing protein [Tepidisphaeraceae bacterium]|nr:DUF1549 and DUF1553 domain-containing protein [Tepidisphaeraceae bacterium]
MRRRWPAALVAVLFCIAPALAAEWPANRPASSHWAFVPPVRPPLPAVKNAAWCRNPIDRFVLAKLEAQGIAPSPEAPRATLLRRVSLDLIGLPPTPAEMDAFLADKSPDAYEKVVDRLLASPHYGERWGRHWLDAARYADSNGYSIDAPRSMWKYRDWVIDATNRDMPFDEFTIEQLAGDLLPNATLDQKIATGFHRNTQINQEGGIDPEQFRVESIIDRVSTAGTVFLGLTIGCAQCHNHKFDPISQKDFYSFFDFFNQCDEPELKIPTGDATQREKTHAELLAAEKEQVEFIAHLSEHGATDMPAEVAVILKIPAGKRSAKQKATVTEYAARADGGFAEREARIKVLKENEKNAVVTTLVMAQRPTPRQTYIFIKGDFTRHGDPVTAAVPAILPQIKAKNPTRLDLARWIVDPANPLTARVTVNRIWQQYFGIGLVETENDFGTQGAAPSNPQLLDWLAKEFVEPSDPSVIAQAARPGPTSSQKATPWSRKAIHRLIVTSATYRQSSAARPDLAESDPYNRLVARQSRLRVDAEIVRDIGLEASGLLCETIDGPSVFPPQPDGVTNSGQVARQWKTSIGPDRYRRGMYTFFYRGTPNPLLTSFDATNATATCTRRLRSNTPLQSLIEMNGEASLEFARAMAVRVLRESSGDAAARIDYAFRLATSRKPSADELTVLSRILEKQLSAFAFDEKGADALAWKDRPAAVDAKKAAAWTVVCRVILNLDETITRE